MKKVYQIVYLVIVFCAAVLFFAGRMGETIFAGEVETVAIGEASFPTVSVLTCGEEINCLYGYSSNMDTIRNREDMIPLDADGIFELKIKEYESDIRRLKYEILDVSSEAEMESGTINAFEKKDDCKIVRIKTKADLKKGTEYAVKVTLISNTGKRIYYYFRIKQFDKPLLSEKLAFIREFGENTRSSLAADNEKVIPYLETKAGKSGDSFHYVDINDNYKTVCWGDLVPQTITEPVISVTEFYDEIMTATVRYCVSIDAGYGEEQYFVEEYFRIRHLGDVVHLLNYERHAETLFDVEKASLSQSDLKVGITSEQQTVLYPNGDNSMVAFERNGALYCYSLAENSIVTVFPAGYGSMERMGSQRLAHEIHVLKMEDDGNLTFLVDGYMNRGAYEGRVGLFVYRYYKAEQRLEELIYIPVNTTYEMLKEELGDFAYLNEYDVFYFMVNGGVYAYNLVTEELKKLAENVREGDYVYSVGERFMAYQEHEKTEQVHLLYPETGEIVSVTPSDGEYIKLLGCSEDNLLYGFGKQEDLRVKEDGSIVYAMYKMQIKDAKGRLIKEYEKPGYYIERADAEENVICLYRLKKQEKGEYEKADNDYILNQNKVENEKITLAKRVTERLRTEYYISFPYDFVMEEVPKKEDVWYTVVAKDTTLRLSEMEAQKGLYYTYYYGMIDGIYSDAGDAIVSADQKAGTVINEKGKIVWERGVKESSGAVSYISQVKADGTAGTLRAALEMMLSTKGVTVTLTDEEVKQPLQQVLANYTKSETVVLTGASLDEVLYFVWKGQPVLARTDNGGAVVITAYNSREITYYDPGKGRSINLEKSKAETMFEEGGKLFISFLY